MHPFTRRCAATLVAAAAALTFGAGSASAYDTCPRYWGTVDTGGRDLAGVLQFCKQKSVAYFTPDLYFFKVPAERVSQGYEYTFSGEQETNPWLEKDAIVDWMEERALAGDRWSLMVNGTFFDSAAGYGRTAFPFFAKEPDPGTTSSLIQTGKHARDERFADERRCIGWHRGVRSNVQYGTWSLESNDYYDIIDILGGVRHACSMPGPGGLSETGEFVVGFDPRFEVDGMTGENALVLVGVSMSGNGMFTTDKLCFLVGGHQTRAVGSNVMQEEFGCRPILQLDGGRSTQLSYADPTTGEIVPLVTGTRGEYNRRVPHFLGVR